MTRRAHPCYVEFHADDDGCFGKLEAVVAALAQAKEADHWRDDDYWLGFLDEAARAHFWWPTNSEREEWSRRWFAKPVERRTSDPSLETPWDFGSMIDAFRNGEYRLLGLRRLGDGVARIEYGPFAGPYGGNECMVALVEAFGFRATAQRD